jgi:hypothetical protein
LLLCNRVVCANQYVLKAHISTDECEVAICIN